MNLIIEIPEIGMTATRAEIINNHTNVMKMLLTIYVGLFSDSGDLLKTVSVDHQLTRFPIPSNDEQWAIALPTIEALQRAENL